MKVSFQLGIYVGTKRRKLALEIDVVVHALIQHLSENVNGFLQADIAFMHDTEDKVLVIAVSLFFLERNEQVSMIQWSMSFSSH